MSRTNEQDEAPRLSVTVLDATSQDDAFPARALERHTQRTRGWHTSQMTEFPVDIFFSFDGVVELSSVRILAHESKIPAKVELHVYTPSEEEVDARVYPPVGDVSFRRLGYLTFTNNETSNFSARELKTVRVKARLLYAKLSIRSCHTNEANVFNQAGFVAIDFTGTLLTKFARNAIQGAESEPDDRLEAEVAMDELTPAKAPSSSTKHQEEESGSPGFDPDTAYKIRQLKLHKAKAVSDEDYDRAKALKDHIALLQEVGPKIYDLTERKREAVEQEDYDVAKLLKRQIDELRNMKPQMDRAAAPMRSLPTVHAPLPPHQPAATDSTPAPSPQQAAPLPRDAQSANAEEPADEEPSGSPAPMYSPPVPVRTPRVEAPTTYDERPAIARGAGDDDTGGIVTTSQPQPAAVGTVPPSTDGTPGWERRLNEKISALAGRTEGHPPPLDAAKMKEVGELATNFGVYAVSCLFAKRWQLRDAALRAIVSSDGFSCLTDSARGSNGEPSTIVNAVVGYLGGKASGVNDSISQVFFTVCDTIKAVVAEDLGNAPAASAAAGLAALLPALLLKAGDSNQRIREKAQTTLLMLALSTVGSERVSAAALHDPQAKSKKPLNYRVHSARLHLVNVLLSKVGLNRREQRTGLTAESITQKLCMPLLTHPNGDVRDAAVQLIVSLHDHCPASLMVKLLANVKPAQMQSIEEALAARDEDPEARARPGKEKEMASSSISVEKGGKHAVLDAARQAQSNTKSVAPPEAEPTKQHRQQNEREAAERAAKTCQFCGKYDKNFTDDLLDEHYARACPLLCPCPLCGQITEIPTLQQHLITECSGSSAVRQCARCREAIPVNELDEHVAAAACIPFSSEYFVCPLCHIKIPPSDAGWDDHLLKAPGCPNNPRSYTEAAEL